MAAVGNWTPQSQVVDLDFLGDGKYQLEFFRDGVNAHKDARDYKKCSVIVSAKDRIRINFAPGGGWTGRFTPVTEMAKPAPKAIAGKFSLSDLNFSSYYAQRREPSRAEPPVKKEGTTVTMPASGVLRIPVNAQNAKAAFEGKFSIEGEAENVTVKLQMVGDGKVLWESSELKSGSAAVDCKVDLSGIKLAEINFDRNPPVVEPQGQRNRDRNRNPQPSLNVRWENADWVVE
jgi:hypothetical protein